MGCKGKLSDADVSACGVRAFLKKVTPQLFPRWLRVRRWTAVYAFIAGSVFGCGSWT